MSLRIVIAFFVLVGTLLTPLATPSVAIASVSMTEPAHATTAWNPCAGRVLITVNAIVTNRAGPVKSGPNKGKYEIAFEPANGRTNWSAGAFQIAKTTLKVGSRIRVRGCVSSEREFIVR